ncbi:MAG TPA: diguanylate cyclase, partial [Halothiobacillus sp.]|nr:diguanylate cyclase [Halothiobacillus sp.]
MTITTPLNQPVEPDRIESPLATATIQRLQEQLERQEALMQSLLGQIGTLISANDEQELLDIVCTQLLASGLFLAAWIAQTDPAHPDNWKILAAGGEGQTVLSAITHEEQIAWVKRLNQVQSAHESLVDPGTDPRLLMPWQNLILPRFSSTLIFAPIARARQPWAVLVVVAQHEGRLDRLLAEMLGRLGDLLSNAFTQLDLRSRLIEEREHAAFLAHHDALTGLANRRGIDEALPKAIARARRNQQKLAVVMLDLDDFKPINDRFGHATGDALLRTLSQRIQATLRETDLAARLGGDEFLLLLEGIDQKKHLKKTLERINSVLTEPLELPEGTTCIRASMGVALFPQDDCEPEQLVRHADAALYLSKNRKRTRKSNWCIWNDHTTDTLEKTPATDLHTPPYGVAAANLLQRFVPQLTSLVHDFVDHFYAELKADLDAGKIIQQLNEDEFTHLKARQSAHLSQLLDPDLTEETHRRTAKRVGEVHALIGLSASSLVRAITIYLHQFDILIAQHRLSPHDHSRLELVLTERLSIELSEELESEHQINNQYQQILLDVDALGRQPLSWQEFNERLLVKLHQCPGIQACWIGAPAADGVFLINFSAGVEPFTEAMQAHYGAIRMPKIAPGEPEMSGSAARAFRQAQIHTIDSFSTAAEAEPWREAALSVGIRSSVGIPIIDDQRRPQAALTLYGAFPNMFETPFRQSFCQQLGFIVSQTWQQFKQTQIVNTSIEELDLWR